MLPASLIYLLRLRWHARLRQVRTSVTSIRGFLFVALGIVMFSLWLIPNIMTLWDSNRQVSTDTVRSVGPFVLLMICLTNILMHNEERGIRFQPAEVDLLFSGPYTRRQLLLYKFLSSAWATLFSATMLSIVMMRYAHAWPFAMLGLFLALWFIQFFSTSITLIAQTLAEAAFTRVRRVLLGGAALLLIGSLVYAAKQTNDFQLVELAARLRGYPWVAVLIFPLEIYIRVITAATIPSFLVWFTAGLVQTGLLFLVVFRLDANFMETSVHAAERSYARQQQARSTGGITYRAGKRPSRLRLPVLSRGGGALIIGWRQAHALMRRSNSLVMLLTGIAAMGIPLAGFMSSGVGQLPHMLVTNIFIISTLMLTQMLPFDFRGDLDHLPYLKSLPIPSLKITLGQLLTPWCVLGGVHIGLLLTLSLILPASRPLILQFAAYVPLFGLLVIAIENWLFLLFPVRLAQATPGDMQHFGRMIVLLMCKLLAMSLGIGLALLAGAAAYKLTRESLWAFHGATWFALFGVTCAVVWLVARAFDSFDVCRDTPT